MAKLDNGDVWQMILVSGIILLILDTIFLWINQSMFEIQIADVQRVIIRPKYMGGVVCYLLLIAGLYWFILRTRRPIWEAIIYGLILYGVFETTNYTIFKKWQLRTVMIDTLWGGALMGLTTAFVYKIGF